MRLLVFWFRYTKKLKLNKSKRSTNQSGITFAGIRNVIRSPPCLRSVFVQKFYGA